VKESFSFEVPRLLQSLPHLKQAMMTYGDGLKIAGFATAVTDPVINNAFNSLKLKNLLSPFESRGISELDIRDQILSYLHASSSYEYLNNIAPTKIGLGNYAPSTFNAAMNYQIADIIDKIQRIESKKSVNLGEEYKVNRFLSNLDIDFIGPRVIIRMANLDPADKLSREEAVEGFLNLGRYEIEAVPNKNGTAIIGHSVKETPDWKAPKKKDLKFDNLNVLQKHLLTYLFTRPQTAYSKNSYIWYIPPRLIEDNSDKFYRGIIHQIGFELSKQKNSPLLESIKDDMTLSFAMQQLDNLPRIGSATYKDKKAYLNPIPSGKFIVEEGREMNLYGGYEKVVGRSGQVEDMFYDRKYENPHFKPELARTANLNKLEHGQFAVSLNKAVAEKEDGRTYAISPKSYEDFPTFVRIEKPIIRDGEKVGSRPVLYVRLNDPAMYRYVYYREVGRPSSDNYLSKISPKAAENRYRLAYMFDPGVREVFVSSIEFNEKIPNKFKVYKKIELTKLPGQEIETVVGQLMRFTLIGDTKRYKSYAGTVVAEPKKVTIDGESYYEYIISTGNARSKANNMNSFVNADIQTAITLEEVLEQIETLDGPKSKPATEATDETPTEPPTGPEGGLESIDYMSGGFESIDSVVAEAVDTIDTDFENVINRYSGWKTPTPDSDVYVKNGVQVDRISSLRSGMINAMRARPWKEDWSGAKINASKFFKNAEAGTKIHTDLGYMTEEEYVTEHERRSNLNRLRGSIIHGILHLHTITDPAKKAQIQSQVDQWMHEAGYEANWFN
jgi:hypothetical protein